MKACEVLKMYQISRVTLGRWVKLGRISCERLPSGHWNYISHIEKYSQVSEDSRKNVIYCRVSTSGQKENLNRQVERVRNFVSSSGNLIDEVYHIKKLQRIKLQTSSWNTKIGCLGLVSMILWSFVGSTKQK